MADLQHTFGNDLTLSATGGLALSDGRALGQERVLRRLLSAVRSYLWHLGYGAGLPSFVGLPANPARIAAVARSQMYRERAVARTPAPVVNVTVQPAGVVILNISYVDATTSQQATLNFTVNG